MDKNQGYEIIKAVMLENGRRLTMSCGLRPTIPTDPVRSGSR